MLFWACTSNGGSVGTHSNQYFEMLSFCFFLAETLWLLALSLSGLSRSSEMGLGSLIDQDSAPI